jgi:DNA-binding transcriptional LysR family regulator
MRFEDGETLADLRPRPLLSQFSTFGVEQPRAEHFVELGADKGEPLASHPLIGWGEDAGRINAAEWLSSAVPGSAIVYRTSSLINQLNAAKAGIGLAMLPCYLGDPEPEIARALRDPVPELARELWIVTHADLRRTARVRAFFDVAKA